MNGLDNERRESWDEWPIDSDQQLLLTMTRIASGLVSMRPLAVVIAVGVWVLVAFRVAEVLGAG